MANGPAGVDSMTPRGVPTAAEVLGQAGAENFPVASRLLPARVRGHLMAIYGFARLADDIGRASQSDDNSQRHQADDEIGAAVAQERMRNSCRWNQRRHDGHVESRLHHELR